MMKRLLATSSTLIPLIIILAAFSIKIEADSSVNQPISATFVIANTFFYTASLPIVTKGSLPLYFDDFSDSNSGWPVEDNGAVKLGYQNGEYEIAIEKKFKWGGAAPPLSDISNYSANTTAHLLQGSSGAYGIIFDREDWNHFYLYAILPSSQEFVLFRHDPDWMELIPFTTSSYINGGSETNRLRVERKGENISIYVNGHYLTSVDDDTYNGVFGEVGLFAQTLDEAPITVRFENFLVTGLPGTTSSNGGKVSDSSNILIGGGTGAFQRSR